MIQELVLQYLSYEHHEGGGFHSLEYVRLHQFEARFIILLADKVHASVRILVTTCPTGSDAARYALCCGAKCSYPSLASWSGLIVNCVSSNFGYDDLESRNNHFKEVLLVESSKRRRLSV